MKEREEYMRAKKAKQAEKDGNKAKEVADKKVKAAEKAVNKADDDIEKEKAHVKLLEAKQ